MLSAELLEPFEGTFVRIAQANGIGKVAGMTLRTLPQIEDSPQNTARAAYDARILLE